MIWRQTGWKIKTHHPSIPFQIQSDSPRPFSSYDPLSPSQGSVFEVVYVMLAQVALAWRMGCNEKMCKTFLKTEIAKMKSIDTWPNLLFSFSLASMRFSHHSTRSPSTWLTGASTLPLSSPGWIAYVLDFGSMRNARECSPILARSNVKSRFEDVIC